MPALDTPRAFTSAKALTYAAYAAFLPIGIVTVLLGPMLPTLSARWALNYSQAGALITVQFVASTAGVALSGVLVSRWGFRFGMKAGLVVIAASLALLLTGPMLLGIVCIGAFGAGLGLAVPAANLLVAEVNPSRRSATLSVLNFCWSLGAVACPFLVAAAVKSQRLPLMLALVAGFSLLVATGIAAMPSSIVEPAARAVRDGKVVEIDWMHGALPGLAALFFVYVGTENGFGLWVASYAKSLGSLTPTMSLMTPSFFYAALLLGRWVAPVVLRTVDEIRLAQAGLIVACAGMAGLVLSHSLAAVVASTSLAGLGLASVYPITISLLSREFGPSASRVGSLMFTMANLGGSCMPWLVGASSTQLGTLKAGLAVPLLGGAVMYVLYLRNWTAATAEQPA
jgi:fucose permease